MGKKEISLDGLEPDGVEPDGRGSFDHVHILRDVPATEIIKYC